MGEVVYATSLLNLIFLKIYDIIIIESKKGNKIIMTNIIKPPLGLTPRWVHEMKRFEEIIAAMKRYSEAGLPVPTEWIEELDELYDRTIMFEAVK